MGCASSKAKYEIAADNTPAETLSVDTSAAHDIESTYKASGAMSMKEIKSRLEICPTTTLEVTAELTLTYAGLSQRGYYPRTPSKANQDAFVICPTDFGGGRALFGVFDGHGKDGDYVSGFLRDNLPRELKKQLNLSPPNLEEAMENAMVQTDERCHCDQDILSGSTAIAAFFDGANVHVANIGDSRAILVAANEQGKLKPIPLSYDQTPYRSYPTQNNLHSVTTLSAIYATPLTHTCINNFH